MSTSAFSDVLDPQTESKADYGAAASRKVELSNYEAPLSALAAHGIEIPHRDFKPENSREVPMSRELPNGSRVHLYQNVRERSDDDAFGDFGAVTEDDEETIRTILDLSGDTVTTAVIGVWKRRHTPIEEFLSEYEPLTCPDGSPQRGY